MRACAITNVRDEVFNLPHWLAYYGRELGPENCIVIDQGSSSLPPLPYSGLIRTPPGPFDDGRRSRMIAHLMSAMLEHYDVVIYTDCDEFLVPDPGLFSGLLDFLRRTDLPWYTALGLDLIHKLDEEDPLEAGVPLLRQRSYAQFNSWLCKTIVTRESLRWDGGFHASSAPPVFGELYLFHSKLADAGESLKRAAQNRKFETADERAGPHHRAPRPFPLPKLLKCASYEVVDMDRTLPGLRDQVLGSMHYSDHGLHYFKGEVRPEQLLRIPERFRDAI
jgi:hypothetical protein